MAGLIYHSLPKKNFISDVELSSEYCITHFLCVFVHTHHFPSLPPMSYTLVMRWVKHEGQPLD